MEQLTQLLANDNIHGAAVEVLKLSPDNDVTCALIIEMASMLSTPDKKWITSRIQAMTPTNQVVAEPRQSYRVVQDVKEHVRKVLDNRS